MSESVWDYPRPPVVLESHRRIKVVCEGVEIAASRRTLRVLETYGAPVFYLPPGAVRPGVLVRTARETPCEWKGVATYFDLICRGRTVAGAAWSYLSPAPEYRAICGYLGFFPALVDCYVDGDKAGPQPGGFYGGWVTREITGPMKGVPGSEYW